MALLISRLFVRSNHYRNEVFGLSRSMFANHLEMIVERGFPLLRKINEILSAMRDMGVMSKLFVDFKYKMTILTSIKEMMKQEKVDTQKLDIDMNLGDDDHHDDDEDSPEIVLTTEHLEGAFTILLAGLIASSIIFILEIFFNLRVVKKFLENLFKKMCCCTIV